MHPKLTRLTACSGVVQPEAFDKLGPPAAVGLHDYRVKPVAGTRVAAIVTCRLPWSEHNDVAGTLNTHYRAL
jgi:hypothetical protein